MIGATGSSMICLTGSSLVMALVGTGMEVEVVLEMAILTGMGISEAVVCDITTIPWSVFLKSLFEVASLAVAIVTVVDKTGKTEDYGADDKSIIKHPQRDSPKLRRSETVQEPLDEKVICHD